MSNNRLFKNATLNTTKTLLGIIFPLITFPYVSRILGVEGIGIYNFSSSFLSYFILFASLGIPTYGIREGVPLRYNKEAIQLFVSELFSINIISSLAAYLLLFVCLFCFPILHQYSSAVFILSGEIIFTAIGVIWVCNIYEDFYFIALRTIGFQIISLILLFSFIHSSADLYVYLVILLISNSGANLFNFFYIRHKYCKFYFTLSINWRTHIKPIVIIFSTTLAITIYVSSDTLLLGLMTDDYEVGLYSTSVKIYTIIKTVLAAFLTAFIPQFSNFLSRGEIIQTEILLTKVFNILVVLMMPMCVGLFLYSDEVIFIISGEDFMKASMSLRLLSIAVMFSLCAFLYSQCILIPIKQEKVVFLATSISAFINIVLNLFFIPVWGINGVAVTTIIAEIITCFIVYRHSKKVVTLSNINQNIKSVLCGCIGMIIVYCLSNLCLSSYVLRFVISFLVSFLVYLFVLILTKNVTITHLKTMLITRTNNI